MRFKRLTHLTAVTAAALAFGMACDDNGNNNDFQNDDPAGVDPLVPGTTDPATGTDDGTGTGDGTGTDDTGAGGTAGDGGTGG